MAAVPSPRIIQHERLTSYLLNADHPVGGAKARYFKAFGFCETEPESFAAALDRHAELRDMTAERADRYGVRREVRCSVATPDGRNPCVIAVWFRDHAEQTYRLLTAYPA